jgi:translation elongation factor EF-G
VAYLNEVKDSIVGGFKLCCQEGPLCDERVRGLKIWVNDVFLHADAIHRGMGQMSPCSKRVCNAAIYMAAPCLLEPIFLVNITCPNSISGSIYNVMSMNRGSVLDPGEGMAGGIANMKCLLPVAESFGFADDLRKRTSGAATSPQLLFSHWEPLAQDPFYAPTTDEERERLGDRVHDGQGHNLAKRYVDAVRARKGLRSDKKAVERAEAQRTRKRQ